MKRKILAVTLTLALTLASSASVVLASDEDKSPESKQYSETHRLNMEKYKKIKDDQDFQLISDNGNGTYSYTYSDKVKTLDDKERFFKKQEEFSAQQTVELPRTNIYMNGKDSTKGYMELSFTDTVIDTDPILGDEKLTAVGNSMTQWFKGGSNYPNWDKLSGAKEKFTVKYDNVSSTAGITMTGPSAAVTISSTYATAEINWPDVGSKNYYNKVYDRVECIAPNITNYTHETSATATVGGVPLFGGRSKSASVW